MKTKNTVTQLEKVITVYIVIVALTYLAYAASGLILGNNGGSSIGQLVMSTAVGVMFYNPVIGIILGVMGIKQYRKGDKIRDKKVLALSIVSLVIASAQIVYFAWVAYLFATAPYSV